MSTSAPISTIVYQGRFTGLLEDPELASMKGFDHFTDTEPHHLVDVTRVGRWNEEAWYVVVFPGSARIAVGYPAAAIWGDLCEGGLARMDIERGDGRALLLNKDDGSCLDCGAEYDEIDDRHACTDEEEE